MPNQEKWMTERSRVLRRKMTDAERLLWQKIRASQFMGLKFRRQYPLGPYIVDFICLEQKLVIEVDGSQHADSAEDVARDAWLGSQGFKVVRFWNHEVLLNVDGVLQALTLALSQRERE
ncbi:MAG: endonuclease domain-containing protein [Moraxellaceae bacterium]